ncbi:MAG: hypothetical protein QXW80_06750 [Candidatus Micrarchaeia archaeon]
MCLYPKLIENKKYKPNKKNGGIIPPVNDERVLFVPVGCGRCFECRRQKRREWQVRLTEDIKANNKCLFVTFSFSEESLDELEKKITWDESYYIRCNEIARYAVRHFLERWRKKYKKSVRHWLVTELGQKNTERVHIHGLLWTEESKEIIEQIWQYGNIWIGNYVNERTINYIVKYLSKSDGIHKNYVPKMFVSPGIGSNYIDSVNAKRNVFNDKDTNETYVNRKGFKFGLPVYYRNKLYNDDERERLWLNKLDEEVRWVDGIKIDISESDEEYIQVREEARAKNLRLGYGTDETGHDEKEYMKRIRYVKHITKAKKTAKKYK